MNATPMQLAFEGEAPPLHQDVHGVIRVGQSRVTLESVVTLFERGATAEEIALRFDVLDLHEIYATLSYYLGHRPQVRQYLGRQRNASLGALSEAEQRSPTAQIRERLEHFRKRVDAQSVD